MDTKGHADLRCKDQVSEAWAWLLHVVFACASLLTAHIAEEATRAVRSDEMDDGNMHSEAQFEVWLLMLRNALRSFLPPSLAFRLLWTPKGTPTRVARTRNPRLGHGYIM